MYTPIEIADQEVALRSTMLPEEIRVKIIRGICGHTYCKRHHELTVNDRILDAGTKPFTKDEVVYLLENAATVSVLYGKGVYASCVTYYRNPI